MDDLLTWLDAYSGGVQAIATLVLVGITWRYVVLTGALARTAQRQLALQEESATAQKREAVAELKSLANSMRHALNDVLDSQSAEALSAVRGEAWMDKVARIEHISGLAGGPYAVRGVAASTILRSWETKTRKVTGGTREEKSVWERQRAGSWTSTRIPKLRGGPSTSTCRPRTDRWTSPMAPGAQPESTLPTRATSAQPSIGGRSKWTRTNATSRSSTSAGMACRPASTMGCCWRISRRADGPC